MKTNIQIFNYNGSDITMKNENGIVYVNLTEIAKAFPEKNLSQIIQSSEIQEYISELSKLYNYSLAENQLITTIRGGNNPGTWAGKPHKRRHQRTFVRGK